MDPLPRARASGRRAATSTRGPARARARTGTSRIAPRQATAATAGRISDSIGTPRRPSRRVELVAEDLERAERASPRRSRAGDEPDERRLEQPGQADDDDGERGQGRGGPQGPRAPTSGHGADRTPASAEPAACPRPRRAGRRASACSRTSRLDPRAAGLADPPAHVVELADVVGVGVDRTAGSRPRPPAGRARRRGPGGAASRSSRAPCRSGRLRVDRVPVEVEVVAGLDHAARRVGDDVDVRAADRRSACVASARPSAGGARRGPRQRRRRTGPAARRRNRVRRRRGSRARSRAAAGSPPAGVSGGAVPAASSAANRALSAAMIAALLLDPVGRQAAGDRERLRVVGQNLVGVAAPAAGLGHDLDRVDAVATSRNGCGRSPRRSAWVDQRWQLAGAGRLDLAAVLAELGLDERQVEEARTPRPRSRTCGARQRRRSAARRPRRSAGSPSRTGSSRGRGPSPGAGRCVPSTP